MRPPALSRAPLAHGAFDFRVPGVADQDHVAPGAAWRATSMCTLVTSGQVASNTFSRVARLAAHRLRHAVRAEDHGVAIRHFVQFLDEHRAARAQVVHHEAVVHDFVAHVDRRAEGFDGALDDLDGAVDAGAEATRDWRAGCPSAGLSRRLILPAAGEQPEQGSSRSAPPRRRRWRKSAMLNAGQ
jgi:hypothetical protein